MRNNKLKLTIKRRSAPDFITLYNSDWYPGIITGINDGTYEISCMEYVEIEKTNKFRCPSRTDVAEYEPQDLLLKMENPTSSGNGRRQGHFMLNEEDFQDASDMFKMV